MNGNRSTALVALTVAIFAGSTTAILIRWSSAHSVVQVFYRLLFTTAFVAPVALTSHREAFARLSRRDLAVSLATGVVLGGHFILFFRSVEWTTVAAAVTLSQTHVAFVPMAAYVLLDESVNRRMVLGLAIAFGGVVVLATGGLFVTDLLAGERPVYGNVLAVLAGVGFAAYMIAGRSVRQRLHLFPYVTVVYATATLSVAAFAIAADVPVARPYPATEWLIFLGLALGPGLLTHTLLNWSLEHIEPSVASVTFLAIPAVSTVLAFVLLAETPSAATLAGGAVVLGGIYLTVSGSSDDPLAE